jgi:hypothetical protein
MGQITRTTNPTDLRQIDKRHFIVRVSDEGSRGRYFWIEKFDYVAAKLNPTIQFACIAHAGSTEEYVALGAVSGITQDRHSIKALATDKPLKFRFIFHRTGESLLVAYADGVRALDESGNLGSSLVDIEPTSLGGIAWTLVLPQGMQSDEKPNVLVEKELFPTAISAVNHPWFGVLVMPEVMRQIALAIAADANALEDADSWIYPWASFIKALGVEAPVAEADDDARLDWAASVVQKFAAKGVFKHHLAQAQTEMIGDQK